MPRVHRTRKNRAGAERSCGKCGRKIEPGQEYLSWSFRYGGTRYRCMDHPPRPSDLTQSKMAEVYAAVEGAQDDLPGLTETDAIQEAVHDVASTVREVAEEYREAAEPFGGMGENAERADELEGWASDLESFYPDGEDAEAAREEAEELVSGCPL